MTQIPSKRSPRRGRVFPEYNFPLEELDRRKAEKKARYKKCRAIFEQVSPELIKDHYNWFMIIEPNTGDYFVDLEEQVAVQKARQKHPTGRLGGFRLNETGTYGKI